MTAAVLRDLERAQAAGAAPVEVPRPLPSALLPVEAFPLAALPDAFRPWVGDVTERMQCPPDFVAVPLLVAASSLAARHCRIRLRQRDDWTEPGNLWAMIVGRPGAMKSPAMRVALDALERLEVQSERAFKAASEEHEQQALLAKLRHDAAASAAKAKLKKGVTVEVSDLPRAEAEGETPTRRRYIVNGPTWEKLHELMSQNTGGLLMVRDELRGWFLNMGREEYAEARSFFVNAWSGGRFTVDRVVRGTVTAEDLRLSIVGAIQPGPLASIMHGTRGGGDDGLLERFLVSWPDDPGAWRDVDAAPNDAARQRVRRAFDHLDLTTAQELLAERATDAQGVPMGPAFVRLDEEAREAFSDWHASLEHRLRAPGGERIEAALSKFRHHVPALALTLHLADGKTGAVSGRVMENALALGDYFESHARRLYDSGRWQAVRAARAILDKARGGALADMFTARNIHQAGWAGLGERDVIGDALEMLVEYGWLAETAVANSAGGRPTTIYSLTEGARRG